MIFIFEGIDGSGKTTLARAFSKKARIQLLRYKRHFKLFSATRYSEIEANFLNSILQVCKRDSFIIDRWHISEKVYSCIFDRNYNRKFWKKIDAFLSDRAVIIYCDADAKVASSRIKIFKREKVDLTSLTAAKAAFDDALKTTSIKVIRIDMNKSRAEQLSELQKKLKSEKLVR